MRVLLDENLDWRLHRHLPGHEVDSVAQIGWSGIKNGFLLRQAAKSGYNVLITMDMSLRHQQNLAVHDIAVIVLRAPSNRLADTWPLMERVLADLADVPPGRVSVIE